MEKDKEILEQDALQDEQLMEDAENAADETLNEDPNQDTSENENQETDPVGKLKAELEEAKNKYLYLMSDFNNFRRNSAKDRNELVATAGRDVLAAMLPVLDDFDRADANGGLTEGTQLIYQKLLSTLQTKGLKAMEIEAGSDFDDTHQEAIAKIPAPSEDLKGKIVDVVDKGYFVGDKILRHAKVVIGE